MSWLPGCLVLAAHTGAAGMEALSPLAFVAAVVAFSVGPLIAPHPRAHSQAPVSRLNSPPRGSRAAEEPPKPADGRTEPHTPSWARTDKETAA